MYSIDADGYDAHTQRLIAPMLANRTTRKLVVSAQIIASSVALDDLSFFLACVSSCKKTVCSRARGKDGDSVSRLRPTSRRQLFQNPRPTHISIVNKIMCQNLTIDHMEILRRDDLC